MGRRWNRVRAYVSSRVEMHKSTLSRLCVAKKRGVDLKTMITYWVKEQAKIGG